MGGCLRKTIVTRIAPEVGPKLSCATLMSTVVLGAQTRTKTDDGTLSCGDLVLTSVLNTFAHVGKGANAKL